MMGLVIFGLLLGYLAIAIAGTIFAVRIAGAGPSSARQRWTAGIVVGLVFYLIPFWDWIPTVVAHKYYCATEAKFEVFKTVEQWKRENVESFETLRFDRQAMPRILGDISYYELNQRIEIQRQLPQEVFLSVTRESALVVDTLKNQPLAKYADFRSGYPPLGVGGAGAWKFWLKSDECFDERNSAATAFGVYKSDWIRIGGRAK